MLLVNDCWVSADYSNLNEGIELIMSLISCSDRNG
jgi:hypothetical protein